MSSESRRKLLKSIAAGSGAIVAGKSLPNSWSRPVVDSVMLPAHALTSMPAYSATGIPGQSVPFGLLEPGNLFADIVDTLVPEASAGNPGDGGGSGYYACAQPAGATANVVVAGLGSNRFTPTGPLIIRRGTLNMDGTAGLLTASGADISSCAPFSTNEVEARIDPSQTNDTQLVIQILTGCGDANGNDCDTPILQLTVPRSATGCLTEPSVYTGECNIMTPG